MMLHRVLREISKDDQDLNHVNSANLGLSTYSMQSGLDSASVDKSKQEEVFGCMVEILGLKRFCT